MMNSGATTLVTIPVLTTITTGVLKCMATTSIDAASIVSSRHTVCTALTATTAEEAASAHSRSRYHVFQIPWLLMILHVINLY